MTKQRAHQIGSAKLKEISVQSKKDLFSILIIKRRFPVRSHVEFEQEIVVLFEAIQPKRRRLDLS